MPTRHAISLRLLTLPGLTSYSAGLQLQQQIYEAVKAGTCPDTLIQLQVLRFDGIVHDDQSGPHSMHTSTRWASAAP